MRRERPAGTHAFCRSARVAQRRGVRQESGHPSGELSKSITVEVNVERPTAPGRPRRLLLAGGLRSRAAAARRVRACARWAANCAEVPADAGETPWGIRSGKVRAAGAGRRVTSSSEDEVSNMESRARAEACAPAPVLAPAADAPLTMLIASSSSLLSWVSTARALPGAPPCDGLRTVSAPSVGAMCPCRCCDPGECIGGGLRVPPSRMRLTMRFTARWNFSRPLTSTAVLLTLAMVGLRAREGSARASARRVRYAQRTWRDCAARSPLRAGS